MFILCEPKAGKVMVLVQKQRRLEVGSEHAVNNVTIQIRGMEDCSGFMKEGLLSCVALGHIPFIERVVQASD